MQSRNTLLISFMFLVSTILIACGDPGSKKKTRIRRTVGPAKLKPVPPSKKSAKGAGPASQKQGPTAKDKTGSKASPTGAAQKAPATKTTKLAVTTKSIEQKLKFIENGGLIEKSTIKIEALAKADAENKAYPEKDYKLSAVTYHIKDLRKAGEDYEALFHRPIATSLTDKPAAPEFYFTKNFKHTLTLSTEVLALSFISKDDRLVDAIYGKTEDDEAVKSKQAGFRITIKNAQAQLHDTTANLSQKALHLFNALRASATSTTIDSKTVHYYQADLVTADSELSDFKSEVKLRKISPDKFTIKVFVNQSGAQTYLQSFVFTFVSK